jgi:uncharacterized protein YacL
MDQEEQDNLRALAQMMGLFGAELKNIDTKYTEKPSTGSGAEFDATEVIRREKSKNGLTINNQIPTSVSHPQTVVAPLQTERKITSSKQQLSSTISESDPKVVELLTSIKEVLFKIDNNLSKISGMAGKIFSNLNNTK